MYQCISRNYERVLRGNSRGGGGTKLLTITLSVKFQLRRKESTLPPPHPPPPLLPLPVPNKYTSIIKYVNGDEVVYVAVFIINFN